MNVKNTSDKLTANLQLWPNNDVIATALLAGHPSRLESSDPSPGKGILHFACLRWFYAFISASSGGTVVIYCSTHGYDVDCHRAQWKQPQPAKMHYTSTQSLIIMSIVLNVLHPNSLTIYVEVFCGVVAGEIRPIRSQNTLKYSPLHHFTTSSFYSQTRTLLAAFSYLLPFLTACIVTINHANEGLKNAAGASAAACEQFRCTAISRSAILWYLDVGSEMICKKLDDRGAWRTNRKGNYEQQKEKNNSTVPTWSSAAFALLLARSTSLRL